MPIIYFLLFFILWIILDRFIHRKFNLERRWSREPVNKLHKYVQIIFFVVFILLIWIYPGSFIQDYLYLYTLGAVAVILFFRTIMEWLFERESKQYITSFMYSIMITLLTIMSIFFLLPKDIHIVHTGYMYSENGEISEPVDVKVYGKMEPNLILGHLFVGKLEIDESTFWVSTARKTQLEVSGKQRSFYLSEKEGSSNGEIWTTRNFGSLAGKASAINLTQHGRSSITFAFPAETKLEAEQLFNEFAEE
ncbi:DUF4181 domain-containing protein [Evansella cellulosilytica]|uniref:Uncharacterized protein n=1 Tax=Evansella cellulosilytica (strain ATCC 21833 / DSM 2522 / FERM P-1141 / JCM 9156 / N-4) TaxID=649639 RepID=E6TRR7_EVAC2|nr:DUF4181 domain-containing protein [Evansella cellulosilytica]ADU29440.1 hypothetical protein Bcell_1175 [Evansella cellulosilytica DSM 2522]